MSTWSAFFLRTGKPSILGRGGVALHQSRGDLQGVGREVSNCPAQLSCFLKINLSETIEVIRFCGLVSVGSRLGCGT